VLVDAAPHGDIAAARAPAGLDLERVKARLDAAMSRLRLPLLIVRGEDSKVSSAKSVEAIAAAVSGAEMALVEDAGHLVATDQVEVFNALLLEFLERRIPREPPEYMSGSDSRTLRDALGCFGTGVTVVTTLDRDGEPTGMTANSFTSVSLDPPLLLVCLAKSAASLPAFTGADAFAVNVLHIGQQPVSTRFATRGEDKFAGTATESWSTGVPIISGSLASFECRANAQHDGGDHVILVGEVIRVRYEPRRDPLLYFRGKYRRLHFA
ncbi:MAG: flavin reductase, partial [Pacificimonas sp.]